ncbi:MAG: DoxX family protein [Acidobacteriota bacterium]
MKGKNPTLTILRVYLALTMIIHGVARIYAEGVLPFGEFLNMQGFPLGFYLAWAITIFEIAGGIVLIIGYFIPILAIVFAVQLAVGIILVHASSGWFVVGLGRNGMEYSVLLIVSFLCVAYENFGGNKAE